MWEWLSHVCKNKFIRLWNCHSSSRIFPAARLSLNSMNINLSNWESSLFILNFTWRSHDFGPSILIILSLGYFDKLLIWYLFRLSYARQWVMSYYPLQNVWILFLFLFFFSVEPRLQSQDLVVVGCRLDISSKFLLRPTHKNIFFFLVFFLLIHTLACSLTRQSLPACLLLDYEYKNCCVSVFDIYSTRSWKGLFTIDS